MIGKWQLFIQKKPKPLQIEYQASPKRDFLRSTLVFDYFTDIMNNKKANETDVIILRIFDHP